MPRVSHGANRRPVLRAALNLGCTARYVRRTGEIIVSHPAVERSVRISANRKDSPRALTGLLRAVQALGTR